MYACMHACIHTYIHTYIHVPYMCTCTCTCMYVMSCMSYNITYYIHVTGRVLLDKPPTTAPPPTTTSPPKNQPRHWYTMRRHKVVQVIDLYHHSGKRLKNCWVMYQTPNHLVSTRPSLQNVQNHHKDFV